MKHPLFILTIIAYLALLIIDTSQLVGLYQDLVGEKGTGVSPWLSLFALNLVVLLLSFRRPDWGKLNPAGMFAVIIGILHFIFFLNRIEGTLVLQFEDFIAQILPAVLFSSFFAFAIYFLADQLASMSEEVAKQGQESRKAFEERMKKEEYLFKERWKALKEQEERLKGVQEDLSYVEVGLEERERVTNERRREAKLYHDEVKEYEARLNQQGRKVKYGNSYLQVSWENGEVRVKKLA